MGDDKQKVVVVVILGISPEITKGGKNEAGKCSRHDFNSGSSDQCSSGWLRAKS